MSYGRRRRRAVGNETLQDYSIEDNEDESGETVYYLETTDKITGSPFSISYTEPTRDLTTTSK